MKRIKTKWSKGHPIISDQPQNVQDCAKIVHDAIRGMAWWWKNPLAHGITFKSNGSSHYDKLIKLFNRATWQHFLETRYDCEITIYKKSDYRWPMENTYVRIRHKNYER